MKEHRLSKLSGALFDESGDAVFIHSFDLGSPFLEVNPKFCDCVGFSREEVLKMSPVDLIDLEFISEASEKMAKLEQCKKVLFETAFVTRDNNRIPIELSSHIVEFPDIVVVLSVGRNISERKKAQEEQLRIQKIESLGILAGGIAHDLNNLLVGILGNISLCLQIAKEEKEIGFLKNAAKAIEAITGLTYQLLSFSKGGILSGEFVSMVAVIKESSEFALRTNSSVKGEFDIDENLWLVNADSNQLWLLIQNIVMNACQAMPKKGGIVRIKAKNVINPIEIGRSGSFVQISIQDTGMGIAKENLGKIFDPYFTTKPKDRAGSGLGLAISGRIIESYRGKITVESKKGKGTTFHIFLPAHISKPEEKKLSIIKEENEIGRLKILVMDDDETICEIITEMLEALDHEVVSSRDGLEAVEKYSLAFNSQEKFDLTILDLTIPGGMGGEETLKKILEIDPNVVAIISSGYADAIPEGFKANLPKPYTLESLQFTIKKALSKKV